MTNYEKLQSEKKKVRHWLHLSLVICTAGLWLPVYIIRLNKASQHNAMINRKMLIIFSGIE